MVITFSFLDLKMQKNICNLIYKNFVPLKGLFTKPHVLILPNKME